MTPQEAIEYLRQRADHARELAHDHCGDDDFRYQNADALDEAEALEMGAAALEHMATCPHCGAERETDNDQ